MAGGSNNFVFVGDDSDGKISVVMTVVVSTFPHNIYNQYIIVL